MSNVPTLYTKNVCRHRENFHYLVRNSSLVGSGNQHGAMVLKSNCAGQPVGGGVVQVLRE